MHTLYRISTIIIVVMGVLFQGCAGFATGMKEQEGISRHGYSIQVGAFKEVRNAERLTAKLQGTGIEAFYFKKDNGVYAVRFGDFPTHAAAKKNARDLVARGMIGSFFIAAPQDILLKKSAPEPPREGEKPLKLKPAGDMGGIAARTAERFVGIPYRWGGNNVVEGMDCSGFVRAVYNLCGVNIPRTSREQFKVGANVGKDDLMDGDLVFFGAAPDQITHVGIYVGDGRFVHAPRRGDDIKISSLGDAYFAKKFIGAKRYF